MIQQTLVLIKPDAVKRGVMGRIISRFEDVGLKVVATKMMWADENHAGEHYFDVGERHGDKVKKLLVDFLVQGPVMAMVLEGVESVAQVRKMVGDTYPHQATPGTIRGDFAHMSKDYANNTSKPVSNLIHASANPEEAKMEIALWFDNKEIHSYDVSHESHTQ